MGALEGVFNILLTLGFFFGIFLLIAFVFSKAGDGIKNVNNKIKSVKEDFELHNKIKSDIKKYLIFKESIKNLSDEMLLNLKDIYKSEKIKLLAIDETLLKRGVIKNSELHNEINYFQSQILKK